MVSKFDGNRLKEGLWLTGGGMKSAEIGLEMALQWPCGGLVVGQRWAGEGCSY